METRPGRFTMDGAARAKRILDNDADWRRLDALRGGPFDPSERGIANVEKAYCKAMSRSEICRRSAVLFAQDVVLCLTFKKMQEMFYQEADGLLRTKDILERAMAGKVNLF